MTHNGDNLLRAHDIHTYYGKIHALRGVSLQVREKEIVTLIGSNGAGKSTLLNTICGILHPKKGEILLEGIRIDRFPAHKVVTMGVSQVPEGRKIFSRLSVTENLELGAFTRNDARRIRDDMSAAFELFPRLSERRRQTAGTLSGGEQQMLAIARAMMARPHILLLDEPSMGLAPVLVETIFETVERISREGTTILLVEQNAMMAFQIATRGYVLQSGQIVMEDTAEHLQKSEMVQKLYLGGETG